MIYHIWLSLLNISKRKAFALATMPGGAKAAYEASPEELQKTLKLRAQDLEALSDKNLSKAERIIKDCRLKGIDIITAGDKRYPERLANIYDPPTALYVRGELPDIDSLYGFAVVGSRKPTAYSMGFAEKAAGELAEEGWLIVSGLALGIDATSHKAALDRGFPTVAVYGTAIDHDYPYENRRLAERVINNGAIVSENAPGVRTYPSDFRIRNRLISGLSLGVLVVQAGERSGSLNTANYALEQGKDVFVLPGEITDEKFKGSNTLIQEGAAFVMDTVNIISSCKESARRFLKTERIKAPSPVEKESEQALSPEEKILYDIIDGKKNIDRITEESGMPAQNAAALLTLMELKGIVSQIPGQIFIKK